MNYLFQAGDETVCIELNMFITAKLNMVSGMVIDAATVMIMAQICKLSKGRHQTPAPISSSQKQLYG